MELPATKRAYELTLAETLGVGNEDLGRIVGSPPVPPRCYSSHVFFFPRGVFVQISVLEREGGREGERECVILILGLGP